MQSMSQTMSQKQSKLQMGICFIGNLILEFIHIYLCMPDPLLFKYSS